MKLCYTRALASSAKSVYCLNFLIIYEAYTVLRSGPKFGTMQILSLKTLLFPLFRWKFVVFTIYECRNVVYNLVLAI